MYKKLKKLIRYGFTMPKYLLWIVITTCLFLTTNSEISKPCVKSGNRTVCYCTRNNTYVDCSSQGLKTIPPISFKFKVLDFRNNSLKYLNSFVFTSIPQEGVFKLDFSANNIRNIEENSLSVFKSLSFLDLSSNPLDNSALKNGLWNISKSIHGLGLSNMSLYSFDAKVFEPLKPTRIQHLDLRYNTFKRVFLDDLFKYLPHLKELNFSNNFIEYIKLSSSKTLTNLRLTRNQMTEFPKFCDKSGKPLFPNLKELYIDKNCIYHIASFSIDCLKSLHTLNISELHMELIPNNLFSKLTSLKVLSIQNSDSLKEIRPLAFNCSSLETLFIRNNKLFFYEPYVNPSTLFVNTPNLKGLDISGNILGKITKNQWTDMLKRVPLLMFLGISVGEIEELPEVIPKYLLNLRDLRAEYNGITEIPPHYLSPLKKLHELYLNDNKFSTINEGDLPKSLKVINLVYNPFVCDCKLLWFRNFIEDNHQFFLYYPRLYFCDNKKPLTDFKISVKSCLLSKKINISIISTCLCFVFLVLGISGVYRYRWRLRFFIHVCNLNRRKFFTQSGQVFLHDIYVVCADSRCEVFYIQENLVSVLEENGKKVFFPRRDASPNKPTVTGTLEQMDRSKCILICISDAFSSDQLCEFQVNMALERSIHDTTCTIIVVILEEVSPVNVNKTINHLLRTHQNYLLWDEGREATELFWRQFNEYIE